MKKFQCEACEAEPVSECKDCKDLNKMLASTPDWFKPGKRVKTKRYGESATGIITSRIIFEDSIYIRWDNGETTYSTPEKWINRLGVQPIDGTPLKLNSTDTCTDCNGTGEYLGLLTVEPCKKCQG